MFLRTDRRCYAHDETLAVVPGRYDYATLRSSSLAEVMEGARFFARWLTGYEQWVVQRRGAAYRQECQQLFAKLEASREWLEPEKGRQWLRAFGEGEVGLGRARR